MEVSKRGVPILVQVAPNLTVSFLCPHSLVSQAWREDTGYPFVVYLNNGQPVAYFTGMWCQELGIESAHVPA